MNAASWIYLTVTIVAIVGLSWQLSLAVASTQWTRVEGKIRQSSVKNVHGDGPSYAPEVAYEYLVEGRLYRAQRMDFGIFSTMTKGRATMISESYQPGDPVAVWYDPAKPSRATLKPGGYTGVVIALIIASLLGPGLVFAFSDQGRQTLNQMGIHINDRNDGY